jgi:hypothetical protein
MAEQGKTVAQRHFEEQQEQALVATFDADASQVLNETRSLQIGEERLDLLTHQAAERKEAVEAGAAAKAASASKVAKAKAESIGVVASVAQIEAEEGALEALVASLGKVDEDAVRKAAAAGLDPSTVAKINGQGHPIWNPNGHHTGGLAIRLFDLRCGDEQLLQVCALLPTVAEKLSSLSISGNNISNKGASALLAVLPQLPRLKYLDVEGNRLGADMQSKLKAVAPPGCKLESRQPGTTGDGPCGTKEDWDGAPRVIGTELVDAVRDLTLPAGSELAPPGWPGPPKCVCTNMAGAPDFNQCKHCVKAMVQRIRKEHPRWNDVNFKSVREALEQVPAEAIPPPKSQQPKAKQAGAAATPKGADLRALAPTCLHIGGIQGSLEDEALLTDLFSPFGTVVAVTLRIRREGKKVSWALVSYSDVDGADKCLSSIGKLAETHPGLVANHVDEQQVLATRYMRLSRRRVFSRQVFRPGFLTCDDLPVPPRRRCSPMVRWAR